MSTRRVAAALLIPERAISAPRCRRHLFAGACGASVKQDGCALRCHRASNASVSIPTRLPGRSVPHSRLRRAFLLRNAKTCSPGSLNLAASSRAVLLSSSPSSRAASFASSESDATLTARRASSRSTPSSRAAALTPPRDGVPCRLLSCFHSSQFATIETFFLPIEPTEQPTHPVPAFSIPPRHQEM